MAFYILVKLQKLDVGGFLQIPAIVNDKRNTHSSKTEEYWVVERVCVLESY